MRLLSERTTEAEATPEGIRALLNDPDRRGAWVELHDERDSAHYLRATILNDAYFRLEERGGFDEWPRHLVSLLDVDETESAMLAFLANRQMELRRPFGYHDWLPDFTFEGLPPVVGFDLRAKRERTLADLVDRSHGDGNLLAGQIARPDIDWPKSADPRIWPSFFERYEDDLTPVWTEFPGADFDFRHFLWSNADAPDIVLRVLPADEASRWLPVAFGIACRPEDVAATDLPPPWREIGFDVAEISGPPYSVLFDMGLGSDEILRSWVAPRLNEHGLLTTADEAFTLVRTATFWAREHAPFCLWRVFLRDSAVPPPAPPPLS